MKHKFYLLIISIILFPNNLCLFDNVQNIESSLDVVPIYDKIIKNKNISLVLIYSDGCPHCRKFEPDYIRLAEEYNSLVDFYILPSKSNYKKKFSIRGVPTLFFFDGTNFFEHKGLNSYDVISYILDNDYLKNCEEVSYNFLFTKSNNNSLLYKNSKNQNLIIGYFPNEFDFEKDIENDKKKINKLIRKKTFKSFIKKTKKIISLLDNCYYIRELNTDKENNNDDNMLKEGTILTISNSKGINIFQGYQYIFMDNEIKDEKYYDDKVKYTGELYSKFLDNKIRDYYIEITDSRMESKLKTFIKRNVIFFVYKNEKEKKDFIKQISSLVAMTKNDKYPLFDYVLFKFQCDIYLISYYFKSSGIYYADKKLKKISKPIELSIIIEMINTQNNYEYNEKNLEEIMNENNTNNTYKTFDIDNNTDNNIYIDKNEIKKEKLYYEKIKEKIIEHQLETYLNNIPEETMFSSKNVESAIFFIMWLIGYTFAFNYIYKIFYPGKSIFNIFNECIDCLNLIFCEDDDEDLSIEEKQIQVKNKKRDDIAEKPKYVKVQFK